MRLASVILDIPTHSLDSPYCYAIPEDMLDAALGCAVLVPFSHRQAIGYVTDTREIDGEDTQAWAELALDPSKIKGIQRVLSSSYFDEEAIALAQFLSDTYVAPLSSCIRLFTPPGGVPRMVRTGGYWRVEEAVIGAVDDRWVALGPEAENFTPAKTAFKQRGILEACKAGELRVAELTSEFGAVSAVLKSLAEKKVVVLETRRRLRGGEKADDTEFRSSVKPLLTEGQSFALAAINAAQERAAGEVLLLDGVTGSGKTEVYLQAIEKTLADGRSAIVLVPEISLTPQTVARFRGRFGNTVAVIHSRMGGGERYDQWDLMRSGAARVVVGARSALFSPLKNLGLIVIDEEHEGSYKQDSAPRYVARDVAAWMAARQNATLVLGSATPSIETLYRAATQDGWQHLALQHRVNGKEMPSIEVIDMAQVFASGHRSMFSHKLTTALYETLDAGHKAVLLLNQRGFAKFLLCRDCGFVPACPACSLSLTYHDHDNTLVCHYCGHKEATPPACPQCNSPYLKKFGAGTQRVEAELRALLAGRDVKVIRMDADTTKTKGAHQKLLEEFGEAQAAVLLGTQMIAKGLDYDEVTLVGVINADTMLKLPDFRSSERTFNLIEQVAGRAGRAHLPGRVLVQTYLADAIAIKAAAAYNRAAFLRDELPKRRALGYPPYVRLSNILMWGKAENEVKQVAESLHVQLSRIIFEQTDGSWTCFPPVPCVLSKLRESYRYHIVLKAPIDADISSVLLLLFRCRKPHKNVNVAIDIDPDDLL